MKIVNSGLLRTFRISIFLYEGSSRWKAYALNATKCAYLFNTGNILQRLSCKTSTGNLHKHGPLLGLF